MTETQPLNCKTEYVDDYELRVDEDCHPATVTAVFTSDDIKAAVEYLKDKILHYGMTTNKEHNDAIRLRLLEYIDESFPDLVQDQTNEVKQNGNKHK